MLAPGIGGRDFLHKAFPLRGIYSWAWHAFSSFIKQAIHQAFPFSPWFHPQVRFHTKTISGVSYLILCRGTKYQVMSEFG